MGESPDAKVDSRRRPRPSGGPRPVRATMWRKAGRGTAVRHRPGPKLSGPTADESTMTKLRSALSVLACLALASPPALAQWSWRDADGRIVVSDRPPPPSVPERNIVQRPPAAAPSPASRVAPASARPASGPGAGVGSPTADPELEARKRRIEEQEAAKRRSEEQAAAARRQAEEQQQAAQRAENCARAREALRTLQDGTRIARVNAAGQREFLDDAQRAREVARVQGVLASDCR